VLLCAGTPAGECPTYKCQLSASHSQTHKVSNCDDDDDIHTYTHKNLCSAKNRENESEALILFFFH